MRTNSFIFSILREMETTLILKGPRFRFSNFLRTLTSLILAMLLSPVGNVHALVECKDKSPNIWSCSDGDTCSYNDAGYFNGCCAGTLCGNNDAERVCCNFPAPICGPTPGTCIAKPPQLPD